MVAKGDKLPEQQIRMDWKISKTPSPKNFNVIELLRHYSFVILSE